MKNRGLFSALFFSLQRAWVPVFSSALFHKLEPLSREDGKKNCAPVADTPSVQVKCLFVLD